MTIVPTEIYSLEEYLKNNPDVKKSELQIIRDWLDKQPHLPKIDDVILLLFFHTTETHSQKKFVHNTMSSKKFTKEGYLIIYGDFVHSDPSPYNFFYSVKYFLMLMELINLKIGPVNGIVVVSDVQNITLGHVGRINIMGLKKFIYFVQDAAPIRLKQINILNWNSALETLLSISKPFMKKELYQMINLTTVEKLEKIIPFDALPNEIGGKGGNIKDLVNEQTKLLEDNREYFIMDEAKNMSNESLRIGKPKSANDLFGVDGSFKKLEID
ncbi:uncharacterized protein LOC122519356 isoform X2 [Polistes fuscatus]|uniref:uncharacterized protein LOC122519356 isoform X2 n=1 Tax=Polistes fuscatus TaxID=30207 RepID=UPI001CA94C96|nr:uncharacterized protein LOC122519356 isoform X2 [Polistes fuscatus]